MSDIRSLIEEGRAALGIELGSTRIKAVLVGEDYQVIASGDHEWENRLENGIWTYSEEDIWGGLRDCYANLVKDVEARCGITPARYKAMGFSAMMHGYLAFDAEGKLLVPFRTWRNQITGQAAKELSDAFRFNIPERWTVAHLRQAILNKEEHLARLSRVNTLAGYVHWKLTGEFVVGRGEGSGIFPLNDTTYDYDQALVERFDEMTRESGYDFKLLDLIPSVLNAGENAGVLTEEGARLLDPTGKLEAGIPFCPPEGDAGTGMTATNSVRKKTGNVSAGTSVFSMVVLEKALSSYYPEIDMVTTPDGAPVAMVHCNNCTSDLNDWVGLFKEAFDLLGVPVDMNTLYGALYRNAMNGDPDVSGILSYNYVSGEHVTGIVDGRPLLVRTPDADFSLANFMRANLYSAFATLKCGNDILLQKENVKVDCLNGHGGIFRTKGVAQQILADALSCPVAVLETAGEGGPWGMALLAAYMTDKEAGETLPDFLSDRVFKDAASQIVQPDPENAAAFDRFISRYRRGLAIEKAAGENL
ncbi:MAG: FGGY-family carbohydrate kinase [Lachnospiraceae bacterium]|nr:FGGY-family carbohydrate kinase [Lachnospiraceae bacterium]